MKIIVIGDIHGRDCWKDIVEKHPETDKYIFLGDYVSTHEQIPGYKQCENLLSILSFKIKNPNRVILLRGNHDMQHLNYYWAGCSGYDNTVAKYMNSIRDKFIKNTQWIYIDNNIVYSHAGISEVWFKNTKLTDINQINELEPSELFGFTPCKLSDYTGISNTQPLTWIRPWALLDCAYGEYTYVVGHTPTRVGICNIKEEAIKSYKESALYNDSDDDKKTIERYNSSNDIWVCDALPKEYLIVDDGKISIGKL